MTQVSRRTALRGVGAAGFAMAGRKVPLHRPVRVPPRSTVVMFDPGARS